MNVFLTSAGRRIDAECSFAIVGAGPYGLAVASHLRAAGFETRLFGKVMEFWDSHMPKGMKLRSPLEGSHISDPEGSLSLHRFATELGRQFPMSLPLEDFVHYGRWFQRRAIPDLDPRNVTQIERTGTGFRMTLDDGDLLDAQNVVIATGIGSFAQVPAAFASLPRELASHASDRINRDLGRFTGRRVLVVGGGQTALESAALLRESGAEVEVLVRQPRIRYLKDHGLLQWLQDLPIHPFGAPGKIGPIGLNWLIEHPRLFTLLPRWLQDRMTRRAIRPAGSGWLKKRNEGIAITLGSHVASTSASADRVHVTLNDGTRREVDHVLLGTGYKIDIARYPFLSHHLLPGVKTVNGYPVLNAGFESTVPGLYFVGTTAAHSFGPLCRFVAGTPFAAATLARHAVRSNRRLPTRERPITVRA